MVKNQLFKKYPQKDLVIQLLNVIGFRNFDDKKYILADDMGLGKTSSAIMASISCKAKKILIIIPHGIFFL